MEKETLKQLTLDYINDHDTFVTKGELCKLAQDHLYSPDNISRRARELVNEGMITVDYYKGRKGQNLARYARLGTEKPRAIKPTMVEKNGIMYQLI